MFAASFDTSDPEIFMAIPKSAYIDGDVSVVLSSHFPQCPNLLQSR